MRLTDAVHLGLMLLALGIAYMVPVELLLLSYVVLGPAHYTTEISWLHDRKYFLPHGGVAVVLAVVAAAAAMIDSASWLGLVMWSAFLVCALFAATTAGAQGVVLVIGGLGLTGLMYVREPSLAVLGVLLPTLIHVSLFTLIFMTLGACRSGSRVQAALVVVYVLAIGLILAFPPTAAVLIPAFAEVARDYFGNVAPALGRVLGIPGLSLDGRFTGLLAFVYTYHYLNWFIKADVIRWADVPPARLALVAVISAASTGLYFYDYALGFSVLLALSLVHVVLEFPLNALAMRQLGDVAWQALRPVGWPPGTSSRGLPERQRRRRSHQR